MAVTWPLVGRREELELVVQAVRGPDGAGIVVAGPLGVGKTRLAREAVATLVGLTVEWCGATPASASIPFGAFAHLLPDFGTEIVQDRLRLLQRSEATLAERASGRPLLVVVDDAQWLDPGGATLVHHLAQRRVARLLLTLRTGEHVSDPVVSLWKDGLVERLELQPLGPADLESLVASVLDGPIDPLTLRRLWELSRGNVLYLRELMQDAVEAGGLAFVEGVWSWKGGFRPSTRLSSIVEDRLGRVSDAGRLVLDHLAIGEPLPLDVVVALCTPDALAEVEGAGLVLTDRDDPATTRLSHPLYAEVLRAAMTSVGRRALTRRLADALAPFVRSSRAVLLRVATWRVESGGAFDPGMLTEAAWFANSVFDHVLAERLARRAIEAGGGLRASLALGDALNRQGRGDEAQAILEPLSELASSDQERVDVAVARYFGLTVEDGFQPEFESVLLDAERRVEGRTLKNFLRAQRATLLSFAGKLEEGLALAESCIAAEPDEVTELRAVSPIGGAWICSGRLDAAAELATRMFEPALRHRDDVPQGLVWVMTIQLSALVMGGRLREADELISVVDAAVASGASSPESTSFLAFARGLVALQRGQARMARRALLESVASQARTTAGAHLAFPLAHLTEACALAGDVDGAITASARADDFAQRVPIYEGLTRRARGWAALARGGRTVAVDALVDAADWAGAHGQRYAQLRALHDVIRLSVRGTPSEELLRLAPAVEGPLAAVIGAHAGAVITGDAGALEAVAEQFEDLGALLLAAEVTAQASVAFRRSRLIGRAERADAHAATLDEACGGVRSPVLEDLRQPVALTVREREVVRLAADGLPSSEIAERLFISTRTVEGHLLRAYSKLGVSDRRGLARVLGAGRTEA